MMEQQQQEHFPLTPTAQQLLARADLQALNSIFYKNVCGFWSLFWRFIGLLLGIGFVTAITVTANSPTNEDGDITSLVFWPDHPVGKAFMILWAIIFLFSIFQICKAFINRHHYICAHPQGVLFIKGDQSIQFLWTDIETIWRGIKTSESGEQTVIRLDAIKLQRSDKQEVFIDFSWSNDNLIELRTFCETVEYEFVRHHLPEILQKFDEGHLLTFDNLRISRTTLSTGDQDILSWEQIERFECAEDVFRIRKYGKSLDWYYKIVPALPNACLLRELAQQRGLIK